MTCTHLLPPRLHLLQKDGGWQVLFASIQFWSAPGHLKNLYNERCWCSDLQGSSKVGVSIHHRNSWLSENTVCPRKPTHCSWSLAFTLDAYVVSLVDTMTSPNLVMSGLRPLQVPTNITALGCKILAAFFTQKNTLIRSVEPSLLFNTSATFTRSCWLLPKSAK